MHRQIYRRAYQTRIQIDRLRDLTVPKAGARTHAVAHSLTHRHRHTDKQTDISTDKRTAIKSHSH